MKEKQAVTREYKTRYQAATKKATHKPQRKAGLYWSGRRISLTGLGLLLVQMRKNSKRYALIHRPVLEKRQGHAQGEGEKPL
jgi:hypothetical protein